MQQQQQQQQPNKEIFDNLQGKKERKEKRTTSSGGYRNWIVKFAKDIAYISFFPYIWIKELLVSSFKNANKKSQLNQSVNVIKNQKENVNQKSNVTSNQSMNITTNGKGKVTLKETADPLDQEDVSIADSTQDTVALSISPTHSFDNVTHRCNNQEDLFDSENALKLKIKL